jgi:hypothetical protein
MAAVRSNEQTGKLRIPYYGQKDPITIDLSHLPVNYHQLGKS